MSKFAAAVLLLVVLWLLLAQVGPLGADWYWTFDPVADRLLAGQTRLYDATSRGYYNAPWAMLLIVPLAQLPLRAGQAGLTMLSLTLLLAAARAYTRRRLLLALGLTNAYVLDLVLRGQLDALVLAGAILSVWAVQQRRPLVLSVAVWLLTLKPVNAVVVLAVLVLAMRTWSWREWLVALSLPVLSCGLAAVVCGPDWPPRYLDNYLRWPLLTTYSVSLWDTLGQTTLLLAVWLTATVLQLSLATGATLYLVALALAANLMVTGYANDSHYVLLIPAWLWLVESDGRWAALYPLGWLPLARNWGYAPEILYPVLLTGCLLWVGLRQSRRTLQFQQTPAAGQGATGQRVSVSIYGLPRNGEVYDRSN